MNEKFTDREKENIEILNSLIEEAKSGRKPKFYFILDYQSFKDTKAQYAFNKKIIKMFSEARFSCIDEYLLNLKKGIDDIRLLQAYRDYGDFANYYIEQNKMLKNEIHEYKCYLNYPSNFFAAMEGHIREEDELCDYSNSGFKEEED